MTFGLSQQLISDLETIFRAHQAVEKAIIYGSRAKGTYHEGSDVDITLVGDALSFKELLQINTEIDDLLTPYSFDISLNSHIAHPNLRDHIKRCGKTLFSKQNKLVQH